MRGTLKKERATALILTEMPRIIAGCSARDLAVYTRQATSLVKQKPGEHSDDPVAINKSATRLAERSTDVYVLLEAGIRKAGMYQIVWPPSGFVHGLPHTTSA